MVVVHTGDATFADDAQAPMLEALACFPHLEQLRIDGCGSHTAATLAAAAPSWLRLRSFFADASRSNPGLQAAVRAAAPHWRSLQHLELWLDVDGIDVDALPRAVAHWPELESVEIFDSWLRHAGSAARFFAVLGASCPRLQELDLSNSLMGAEAWAALAAAGPSWPALRLLRISLGMDASDVRVLPCGGGPLWPGMEHFCIDAPLAPQAAELLFTGVMRHWSSLHTLSLTNTEMGAAGAAALAREAGTWQRLRSFHVYDRSLGEPDAALLAEAASKWSGLQEIRLHVDLAYSEPLRAWARQRGVQIA